MEPFLVTLELWDLEELKADSSRGEIVISDIPGCEIVVDGECTDEAFGPVDFNACSKYRRKAPCGPDVRERVGIRSRDVTLDLRSRLDES